MSALSDLLRANLPDGWSARRVARETEGTEYEIKQATATAYLGGRHGRPDLTTLEAFHQVLRIPMRHLREAAQLHAVESGSPWKPPEEANQLDGEQRKVLESLIKVMTREREEVGNHGSSATTKRAPGSGAPPVDYLHMDDDMRIADVHNGPDDFELAAMSGTPGNLPDTTAGEESQDPDEVRQ